MFKNKKGASNLLVIILLLVIIGLITFIVLTSQNDKDMNNKENINDTAQNDTTNVQFVDSNTESEQSIQVVQKSADERAKEYLSNVMKAYEEDYKIMEKAIAEATEMPNFGNAAYKRVNLERGTGGEEINTMARINSKHEVEFENEVIASNAALLYVFRYAQNAGYCLVIIHGDGSASFADVSSAGARVFNIKNAKNVVSAFQVSAAMSDYRLVDIDGNIIVPDLGL